VLSSMLGGRRNGRRFAVCRFSLTQHPSQTTEKRERTEMRCQGTIEVAMLALRQLAQPFLAARRETDRIGSDRPRRISLPADGTVVEPRAALARAIEPEKIASHSISHTATLVTLGKRRKTKKKNEISQREISVDSNVTIESRLQVLSDKTCFEPYNRIHSCP